MSWEMKAAIGLAIVINIAIWGGMIICVTTGV